jgi:hypothetical protein
VEKSLAWAMCLSLPMLLKLAQPDRPKRPIMATQAAIARGRKAGDMMRIIGFSTLKILAMRVFGISLVRYCGFISRGAASCGIRR